MTTISFVAGLMPLLIATGPGAEERRSIAVLTVGGPDAVAAADAARRAGDLLGARRSGADAARLAADGEIAWRGSHRIDAGGESLDEGGIAERHPQVVAQPPIRASLVDAA
ncbi:MAG TPA: hypothetical protein VM165_05830 [Planctomycetaceae bacterium]|nr:hypothetical protein [Planctomycetaceae bacterium]